MFTSAPLNAREPMVNPDRTPSKTFLDVWTATTTDLDASPARLATVALTTQGAAIGATPINTGGALSAGLYRVSWYLRITQAAAVSSSVTLSITYTDGGVVQVSTAAAVTGNTTTTTQSGSVLLHVDNASPISYSTAYASVGSPSMEYSLRLVVEQVAA